MKKPTLKQLQKRPALWWDDSTCEPIISYHGEAGFFIFYDETVGWFLSLANNSCLLKSNRFEFMGWL